MNSSVVFARHRHREGYVTIVLSGEYEETGDYGRRRAVAGDVMFHNPFDAHANRMSARSTELFSMALPSCFRSTEPHACLPNADAVVVKAERDPTEALQMITHFMQAKGEIVEDWPDVLAGAMILNTVPSFHAWAVENDLHSASLARGFRQIYGITPCRYRFELRSKRAWQRIMDSECPLGILADELGFSDQAHMSRSVKALTGQSPGGWRRLKTFKTGSA